MWAISGMFTMLPDGAARERLITTPPRAGGDGAHYQVLGTLHPQTRCTRSLAPEAQRRAAGDPQSSDPRGTADLRLNYDPLPSQKESVWGLELTTTITQLASLRNGETQEEGEDPLLTCDLLCASFKNLPFTSSLSASRHPHLITPFPPPCVSGPSKV
ncbi:hypothetical protein AAFF_G00230010 [Aldrovandia affinis]|uniref:Uncharacterized protein n=1 Tax=Aldrovandia affinis TaxID=143900 RepID=A0AAD7SVS6_9TELE|nr:hypothetical protein AAFF_G00230010 [Aldrovandia affinis]